MAITLNGFDASTLNFSEGNVARFVASGSTLNIDGVANGTTISQIRFEIVSGTSFDNLILNGNFNGITAAKPNNRTLLLTISNQANLGTILSAIKSVSYVNNSVSSLLAETKTLSLSYSLDNTNFTTLASRQVIFTPINNAPTISTNGTLKLFTEGRAAVYVAPDMVINDVDSPSMASFQARISNNYQLGADSLRLSATNATTQAIIDKVNWSFNTTTGILAVNSKVAGQNLTRAEMSSIAQLIAFSNSSINPTIFNRVVEFTANDGSGGISPISKVSVKVLSVNSAPNLWQANGFTIKEGGSVTLNSSNFSITDIDNTDTQIIIRLTSVSGGTFYLNKELTQAVEGKANSAQFTLADVKSGKVTFIHNGGEIAPSYSVQLANPDGTTSSNSIFVIPASYTAINDAPSIALGPVATTSFNFIEGSSGASFASEITLMDPDNIVSGLPTIRIASFTIVANYQANQDFLGLRNIDPTIRDKISVFFQSGTLQIAAKTGVNQPSYSEWQTIFENIYYINSSTSPNLNPRSIRLTASDGLLTSNGLTYTITISSSNQVPILTGTLANVEYKEGNLGVLVAPNISVYDSDNSLLNFAKVKITKNFTIGDVLEIQTAPNNFIWDYDAKIGELSIYSKGASPLNFQTILRQVKYRNTTTNPGDLLKTVEFFVNDGLYIESNTQIINQHNSNILKTNIVVIPDNQAPVLTGSQNLILGYVPSQRNGIFIADDVKFVDLDSTPIDNITIVITNGFRRGEDSLEILNPSLLNGASFLFDDVNGILNIRSNGVVNNLNLNQIMQAVQFRTSADVVGRRFQIIANDGYKLSNIIYREIVQSSPLLPITALAATFSINEGATKVLTLDNLGLSQNFLQNTLGNNLFIIDRISGGKFTNQNNTQIDSFTVDDVKRGLIKFTHDGSENVPLFNYRIKGATGLYTINLASAITRTPINDAPIISATDQLLIYQGETIKLNPNNFIINDPDNAAANILIKISRITNGAFYIDGKITSPDAAGVVSFNYDDIVKNRISFKHNGIGVAPSFYISVKDPNTPYSTETPAAIRFVAYNQIPIITNPQIALSEGQSYTLTATINNFFITDNDSTASDTIIELSGIRNGIVQISGFTAPTNGVSADTAVFNLNQLRAGQVKFIHDGGEIAPTMFIRTYNTGAIIKSDIYSVAVNYTPVNDKPTIANAEITISEGQNVLLTDLNLGVNDIDSLDEFVTIFATNILAGSIFVNNVKTTQFTLAQLRAGQVVFQHDGTEKPPSFFIQARDNVNALSDKINVTINFNYINDAPSINKSTMTISEGQNLTITLSMLSITDVDSLGTDVFIRIIGTSNGNFETNGSVIGLNEKFTLAQVNQGAIQFHHDGSENPPSFIIEAANSDGKTSPQVIYGITNTNNLIKYGNINDAPIINDTIILDPTPAVQGAAYKYTILPDAFLDPDSGDKLTYSATLKGGNALPSWLKLNTTTGQFTGTPTNNDVGVLSLTIYAFDKNRLSAYQDTVLTITNVNDAPLVNRAIGTQNVLSQQFFYRLPEIAFKDADNDNLTITTGSLPAWLSFNPTTRILQGTRPDLFTSSLKVNFFATDGQYTASQTITFTQDTNLQPILNATIPSFTIFEDNPFNFSLANNIFLDANRITYSILNSDGGTAPTWLNFDAAGLTLKGVANNDAVGIYNLLLVATDSGGAINSTKLTLNVQNTFDLPLFNGTLNNQTTNQGTIFSYQVPANFVKVIDKGQIISYTANLADGSALPSWLSFDAANGLFFGIAQNADVGTKVISLNITSPNGFKLSQNFNLTVNNVNDAPVALGSLPNFVILRNNYLDVSINPDLFIDPDGDNLTYKLTQADGANLPAWVKFNAANLNITGTPGATDVGSLWVKLTVTDTFGAQVYSNFNIEVTDINKAPSAVFLSNNFVAENAASGTFIGFIRIIDPDPATTANGQHVVEIYDGDKISSNFYYENGNLRTLRPLNYELTPFLNIKIRGVDQNGAGIEVVKDFTITLTNVNDAPTVLNAIDNQNFSEKTSFRYLVSPNLFTDEDVGDVITVSTKFKDPITGSFTSYPTWLNYNSATGIISGTATNDEVGSYTIRFIGQDRFGAQVITDHIINILNVNDAPTHSGPANVKIAVQDKLFTYNLPISEFNDIDRGDSLTYAVDFFASGVMQASLPNWLVFNSQTLTLTGTPHNQDVTTNALSLRITAKDKGGLSASTTLFLSVQNVNDKPFSTTSMPDIVINENDALNFNLNPNLRFFSDPDLAYGDNLSFNAYIIGASGVLNPLPNWMAINRLTNNLTGIPRNADVTTDINPAYKIRIEIIDSASQTTYQDIRLTVNNVNDVPIIGSRLGTITIAEDKEWIFNLPSGTFIDIDYGDSLTYAAQTFDRNGNQVAIPSFVFFNSATGFFSATPRNENVGQYLIRLTATDKASTSVYQDFALNVSNTNDFPVVVRSVASQSAKEASIFNLNLNGFFSDPDIGDSLTLSLNQNNSAPLPSFLSFNQNTLVLSGTPEFSDSGTYTIFITARDRLGAAATSSFSLFVDTLNHVPQAPSIAVVSATEEQELNFILPKTYFSDPDGDAILEYTANLVTQNGVAGLPNWLVFNVQSTTFSLNGTPQNADTGTLTIRLGARDSHNAWGYRNISLFVSNTNDAPSVNVNFGNLSATETELFSYTLPSNAFFDQDPNDKLSYNIQNLPSWLSFDADSRTLKGTAFRINAPALSATDFFTYSLSVIARDLFGETASQTLNITLKRANNPPTDIQLSSSVLNENQLANHFIGNIQVFDPDTSSLPDGQTNLILLENGGISQNFFVLPISGTVNQFKLFALKTFDRESKEIYNVEFKATDNLGLGKSLSKFISITINNVDEGPPAFVGSFAATFEENLITTQAVIIASAVDPDRDQITYILTNNSASDNSFFTINQQTGAIFFKSPPDFEARNPSYLVQVGAVTINGSSTRNFNINLVNIDEGAPQFVGLNSLTIAENRPIDAAIYTINATDPDFDSITYALANGWIDNSEFRISGNQLFFTKIPDFERKSSYIVRVNATANNITTTGDLRITIQDLPDTDVVFISPSMISVNENVPISNIVYQLLASNQEQSPISFTLESSVLDNDFFSLSGGSLFFKSSPNFETKPVYRLQFQATSNGQKFNQQLTIAINNLDEFNPSFVTQNIQSVAENTLGVFFTARATDGDNDIPSYTLTRNYGDNSLFRVNSLTGGVEFISAPDFETRTSYEIQVQATTNSVVTSRNFSIIVTNLPEGDPVFLTASVVSFAENDLNPVYTAIATDQDKNPIVYTLANLPASISDNSFFSINSSTGIVSFLSPPDYESAKKNFVLSIVANSPSHSTTQQVAVNIVNIDEFGPSLPSFTSLTLAENAIGSIVITASDIEGDVINYFLETTGSSTFDNLLFTINSTTGLFQNINRFDREVRDTYTVRITAKSKDRTSNAIYIVKVANVDEGNATFTSSATVNLNENFTGVFHTITARDIDGDTITYQIDSATQDGSLFSINSITGGLNIISAANFESNKKQYSLNIIATANGAQTQQQLIVNVQNIPEGGPSFVSPSVFSVNENYNINQAAFRISASDPDLDNVTYQLISGALLDSNNFTINSITGEVFFSATPDYETKTTYMIKVVALAGGQSSSEQTITLNINNLDDNAPVIISPSSVFYDENTPTSLAAYQAIATDADGGTITYGIDPSFDSPKFSINSVSGEIFFISSPNYEEKNEYRLNVFTQSGKDKENKTVAIFINNINESAPVFVTSNLAQINENQSGFITKVIAVDGDGDGITYSLLNILDASTTSITTDGRLSFLQGANYEVKNAYSFAVIATARGDSVLQNLVVSINNVDEFLPSILTPASFTINENYSGPIVTIVATDADLVAPSFALLNGPNVGRFSIDASSGELTFINPADWEAGSTTFVVSVEARSQGRSTRQDISVFIANLDESAPSFTSPSFVSVNENFSGVFYNALASDFDGQTPSYTLAVSGPGLDDNKFFTINSLTGELQFISSSLPDFESGKTSYSVVLTARSGIFSTNRNVVISVVNVDESAPVFTTPSIIDIPENYSGSLVQLAATDFDGDAISYTLNAGNDSFFFNNTNNGLIAINTKGDYESTKKTYNIIVRASAKSRFTEQNITFRLIDIDEGGPSFTSVPAAISVNENNSASFFSATISDIDGDIPTYLLDNFTTDNKFFTIDSATGALKFSATPDFEAQKSQYIVNITAVTRNLSATQSYTINLNDVDDNLPSFVGASLVSVPENKSGLIFQISAVDNDSTAQFNKITYGIDSAFASGSLLTINSLTGEVSLTSPIDFETNTQNLTFRAKISATNGVVSERIYEIQITNVQEFQPVITSSSLVSVLENTAGGFYSITGTDGDKDNIIFSIANDAANLFNYNSATKVISFKNAPDYETMAHDYSLTLTANDGTSTINKLLVINVLNVNESATIFTSANNVSVAENTSTAFFNVLATDGDAVMVSYTLPDLGSISDNQFFSLDSQTGALKFISPPNYESGRTNFFITLRAQADGAVVSQNITINVTNIDEGGPSFTAVVVSATVNENSSGVFYNPSAADIDGDAIKYFLASNVVDNNLFSINSLTGDLRFIAGRDYETQKKQYDAVITAVSNGISASQNVRIGLIDIDDNSPVFTGTNVIFLNEGSGTRFAFQAMANDADISPQFSSLTYSIESNFAQASLFSINSLTGDISVVSVVDFESFVPQPLSIRVRASAPNNKINDRIYTISLNNVQEFQPVFTSPSSATVAENSTNVFYTATATDGDKDIVTFSLTGNDAEFFTINSQSGQLRFISGADFEAKRLFNIILTAQDVSTTTNQNLVISLTNINEFSTVITSSNAVFVSENTSGVFFSVVASDNDAVPIIYQFVEGPQGVQDNGLFSIDSMTGAIKFNTPANYEVDKDIYFINVAATADGKATTQNITINLINIDEFIPSFTSPSGISLDENFSSSFILSATDGDKNQIIKYEIIEGGDASAFSINSLTGAIRFLTLPDFESGKTSYTITLNASSTELFTQKRFTININNIDEFSPAFSQSSFAFSFNENTSGVLFKLTATDLDGNSIAYTTNNANFSVNSIGEVRGNCDFETNPNPEFLLIATTNDGKSGTTTIKIHLNDLDEFSPSFVSGVSAITLNENTNSSTVIHTYQAIDLDANDVVHYSLAAFGDNSQFSIGDLSGDLKFISTPNFENPMDNNDDGIYNLKIIAFANGKFDTRSVNITLNNVNEGNPSFTSESFALIAENTPINTNLKTINATDIDSRTDFVHYFLIASQADNVNFAINSLTGAISNKINLNYEDKNIYNLIITASTPSGTTIQNFTLSLSDVSEGLISFTAGPSLVSISENYNLNFAITSFTAADPDSKDIIRINIESFADGALFSIDSATGALKFANSAPNFEQPADANGDNIYVVRIKATSSDSFVIRDTSIAILNIDEGNASFVSASSFTINENIALNSPLSTIKAIDIDSLTDNVSYFISGAGDSAFFTINSLTGVISNAMAIDFETNPSFTIVVGATTNNISTTKSVIIKVNDLDDGIPTFTPSSISYAVDENSSFAFVASASVAQGGASIVYALGDTPQASLFTINSLTGKVSLTNPFDYENIQSATLLVIASTAKFVASQQIKININNIDEFTPTITNLSSVVSISENTGSGTNIFAISATDGDFNDVLSYQINPNFGDAQFFSINSATGVVSWSGSFMPNYESAADFGTNNNYDLNIIVRSTNLATSKNFRIVINNIDESATIFTDSVSSIQIDENTPSATIIFTAMASDFDAQPISYILKEQADNSFFQINSDTGVVRFKNIPNFEQQASYKIIVSAQTGIAIVEKSYSVTLNDIDEFAPSITNAPSGAISVNENIPASLAIYNFMATDLDVNQIVSFTLPNNIANNNSFSITQDGKLRFLTSPNFESQSFYSVTIRALSGSRSVDSLFSIAVQNISEGGPAFNASQSSYAINENFAGSFAKITATDLDNDAITYSISGTDANIFSVNNSGVLSLRNALNYETDDHSYSITLVASSSDGFGVQNITINLNNIIESGEFGYESLARTINFAENQAFSLAASATNNGLNPLHYFLSTQASGFSINSDTGVISHAAFDFETLPNIFTLKITATNNNISSSQEILLNITDVADTLPVFTSANSAPAVNENASSLVAVYQATASTAGTNPISFTLSQNIMDNNNFIIGSDGILRFTTAPDFETKPFYSVTINATTGFETSSKTLVITIQNVSEGGPRFANSFASYTLNEDTLAMIGTASAADPDRDSVTYSLTGADATFFTISSLGVISNTQKINFEDNINRVFSITVAAKSNDGVDLQFVQIKLKDLPEGAGPSFTMPSQSINFDENASFAILLSATGLEGRPLTYSLADLVNAPSGITINSETGEVKFSAADFETSQGGLFRFNVVVSNQLGQNTQLEVLGTINDVDENSPSFTNLTSVFNFDENLAATNPAFTAVATDIDGQSVSYSLDTITSNTQGASFTIDSQTGVVKFKTSPNFETRANYDVIVQAKSGNLSSTHIYTVSINNIDEFNPSFTSPSMISAVNENIASSLVIYTAVATDADLTSMTYSLTPSLSDNNLFTINNAGLLRFISSPDFESGKTQYSVTITAGSNNKFTQQLLIFSLTNLDDNAPSFTNGINSSITIASIAENSSATNLVFDINATDADGTAIVFTLSSSAGNDNQFFNINATTGEVFFNSSPNYETNSGIKPSYDIKAIATSGNSSSVFSIHIDLQNIKEGNAISSTNGGNNLFLIEDMNFSGTLSGGSGTEDTVQFYDGNNNVNLTSINLGAGGIFNNIEVFDLGANASNANNFIIISPSARTRLGASQLIIKGNASDAIYIVDAANIAGLNIQGGVVQLTATTAQNNLNLTNNREVLLWNFNTNTNNTITVNQYNSTTDFLHFHDNGGAIIDFTSFSNAYQNATINAAVDGNNDIVIDFTASNASHQKLIISGEFTDPTGASLTLNEFVNLLGRDHLIFG